ncbi:hypothetical protein BM221_006826 [Beauveria bassiana]|uniref:Uncharacterized protein n=1 Tax=Beauveria bassiana TaxID=176275 RepID=A0A2N6NIU7_BEABA|nr:hypothetical protein BM221_006826 [Beauveria bassiana]
MACGGIVHDAWIVSTTTGGLGVNFSDLFCFVGWSPLDWIGSRQRRVSARHARAGPVVMKAGGSGTASTAANSIRGRIITDTRP